MSQRRQANLNGIQVSVAEVFL